MITGMLRRYEFPSEYELTPTEIDIGANWITLKLKRKEGIERKIEVNVK